MQIKKIFLYSVPYTEDDHHQPLNSALPDDWEPIKEFLSIKAHLFNFGSSIELTAYYDEIINANYAKFVITMKQDDSGEDVNETYYAWIDGFDLKSQQLKGSIKILYHWDYWRTFKNKIIPLRGTISQRKEQKVNPPQMVPNIIESYDQTVHQIINQNRKIAWVYMVTVDPSNSNGIQRIAFPVCTNSYFRRYQLNDSNRSIMQFINAPSFKEVIDGSLLKIMGIDSEKLIGCSVSSIPPLKCEFIDELNQIIVPYTSSSPQEYKTKISIYTYDLIEHYEKTIRSYEDIFKKELNVWTFNTDDDKIKFANEIKWWCYPRNDIIYKFDNYLGKDCYLELHPSVEQYYPFLQQLKWYFSDYNHIKKILIDSEFSVRLGRYFWDYIPSTIVRRYVYNQRFEITYTDIKIVEIEKINSDWFNITFDNGLYLEHVSIGDILLERPPEDKQFSFIIVTDIEYQSVEPKIFGDDATLRIAISNVDGVWPIQYFSFEQPISSTPLNSLYLVDNNRYPINKFEQGRDLLNYTVQAISQNNQMFVLYKFNSGSYIDNTEFAVNMTPIDLTQEYINEYILSGEREAANERRTENIMSSLVNLAANTAVGTLIAGPAGGIIGAGKSFAKTLGAGILTTGVIGELLGNYQQGQIENRLRNRGSFLIRSGNDYSWLTNGYLISIVKTKFDGYSIEQYENKVYEFGIDCAEIDKDGSRIQQLLTEEGPIRLSSITLDKDIPYEANNYIRQKLLNGVFLDSALTKSINIVK